MKRLKVYLYKILYALKLFYINTLYGFSNI